MSDVWKLQYKGEIKWQIEHQGKPGAVSDMRPDPNPTFSVHQGLCLMVTALWWTCSIHYIIINTYLITVYRYMHIYAHTHTHTHTYTIYTHIHIHNTHTRNTHTHTHTTHTQSCYYNQLHKTWTHRCFKLHSPNMIFLALNL